MQVNSVPSAISSGPASLAASGQSESQSAQGIPFAKLMSHLLNEADKPQQTVMQDMDKLIMGEVDNIHEVAINVAKADVAFRIVMEVRDKLIAAYQDVMRMQV